MRAAGHASGGVGLRAEYLQRQWAIADADCSGALSTREVVTLVARLNASAAPFRLWRQTNNNTSPPSVGYFVYAASPGGSAVQVVGKFDGAVPAGIEEWSSCLV